MSDFILYGAYGYTGKLITRYAAEYGLKPLLSGRNADKLRVMSEEFGFAYEAVNLSDQPALHRLLEKAPVVLHVAGPFVDTATAMHDACLATNTHYLDITGEIEAFAQAQALDRAALAKGIMLMPGVGFDVVPTDCLAAHLKERLADATDLTLAFAWKGGGISQGTAKSMLNGLGRPGAIRQNGKITPVPAAYDVREFPFAADRSRTAVTIPWGDVFTAFYTTGIPNIKTYFAAPKAQQKFMKWSNYLGPVLRHSFVKNYLRKKIEGRPEGPTDEQRAAAVGLVYGEAKSEDGRRVRARLKTLEGYTLTAKTALLITKKVLAGEFSPGYQTPAGLYGASLILEISGCVLDDLAE